MAAQHGDKQLKAVAEAADDKAHAVFKLLNVRGEHVAGVIFDAEVVFFVAAVRTDVPQQGLVTVEDADAVFRHAAEDLELGLQDALAGAQVLDVHGADVGDDGDIRPRDGGQVGHLAEVVHAHFEHGDLGVVRHVENGHGKAEVIVVVALGAGGMEAAREQAGRHFLGRRLADAAGDADDGDAGVLTVGCRQIAVGADGVGDEDGGDRRFHGSCDQRGLRAEARGHGDKVMAVGLLALDGDKEVAGPDSAGVGLDAGDGNGLCLRCDSPVAGLCDFPECQFFHLSLSRYARTTSRSSRWRFSCPIS